MNKELEKACEEAADKAKQGTGYRRYVTKWAFKDGFHTALKPEHMKLTPEVRGLIEALEFYKHSGKTKTIRGKIIEYDVDVGPLYESYEMPYCDEGQTARRALKPFEKEGGE
jgi:hypothetical protein